VALTVGALTTTLAVGVVAVGVRHTRLRLADRSRRLLPAASPASVIGEPRRVRDWCDPIALGVHPTAVNDGDRIPPYVRRDADDELRAALGRPGLVLLVGDTMAGKSRMAFEAMRATLADHVLALPVDAAALVRITPTVARQDRCVVWLDDVERFLVGDEGLTSQLLTRLLGDGASHIVVLATMRRRAPGRCLRARGSGSNTAPRDVWHRVPEVIERAEEIVVDRRWSVAELARAEACGGDPVIARALRLADRFGVAEGLTAGPALLGALRNAWTDGVNPRGAALVTAAVDCRRAGLSSPVPVEVLEEIHEWYLAERGGRRLRPESFEAAVRFATAPVGAGEPLLARVGGGSFAAHDYLVDALTSPPVPDRTWQALINQVTGPEAYDLGVAALNASRFDHARAALARAVDETDDARGMLAVTVGESGRPDEAAEMLRGVLTDEERRLAADHPDVLAIRHDLACWRGEAGDPAGAVAALRKLATRVGRLFGADHVRTLAIRHDLACWRGEAGDPAGAVAALRKLATRVGRLFGADHVRTLAIRHDLACWRGEAGDPAGAVAALRKLLDEAEQRLGAHHPDVVAIRHDLACWRAGAGDATGAVLALEALLVDAQPLFGSGHPRVMALRHDAVLWRGETGGAAGSVAALAELLVDQVRVLGPDHPGTLATRHDLALLRGRAGDAAGAVTALEDLLGDVHRVLGPDHPHTLTTRHNLAHLRGEAGDVTGAVAALGELYPDRLRVLGLDHPGTQATGHNLAAWRGRAGDPSSAVAALEGLLADQLRVLGPAHAHTLATRQSLASVRGETGDAAGAVVALEALLSDLERLFGPDHGRTLAVRHDLARWRGEAGDVAGAGAALEALLADQLRVLGRDHPGTLAARHNLAFLRGRAGNLAGAEAALEGLLPHQVRVLGPEHPGTVATRHNLAHLRRERRAARLLRRVLRRVGVLASTGPPAPTPDRRSRL
jgi:hypothetical protein